MNCVVRVGGVRHERLMHQLVGLGWIGWGMLGIFVVSGTVLSASASCQTAFSDDV